MFYYLYEIKNKIDGKIYIGVHKTKNLDDAYMGSGKLLNRAIKKYGIENFEKTILKTFNTVKEMYDAEKEIITDDFLLREDTYNIKLGGLGGFDYINSNKLNDRSGSKHSIKTIEKRSKTRKERFDSGIYDEERKIRSDRMVGNRYNKKIFLKGPEHPAYGKKSKEHIEKIRDGMLKSNKLGGTKGRLKEKIECPHCKKIGGINQMKRWHFDNCRNK